MFRNALVMLTLMVAFGLQAVMIPLSCPHGTATVSTYGGVMTSWRPLGGDDVFASAVDYEKCERGTQIHCGLPICWPWAVNEGPVGGRIHGVARYAEWKVKSRTADSLVLELDETEETLAAWPHKFHLELHYSISNGLDVAFLARNTDDHAYACTELFHPYFSVGDVGSITVSGLNGCRYLAKTVPGDDGLRIWRGDFTVPDLGKTKVGYVFDCLDGRCRLNDPKKNRWIEVKYTGSCKICLWNSGLDFSVYGRADRADFGRRFMCVEGGTIYRDRAYTLASGESHVLKVRVTSGMLGLPPVRP